MSKTINIAPKECGPHLQQTIRNKLHHEVQGTRGLDFSHIVAVNEIERIGKGKVLDETGYVSFNIHYRAIVFRPIVQEVVAAIVTSATDVSFTIKLDRTKK